MSYYESNNSSNTSLCTKEAGDKERASETKEVGGMENVPGTDKQSKEGPAGEADPFPVTMLLRAWQDGEVSAEDRLFPMLYVELKKIAGTYLDREFGGPSMQTTELVNEAFLRLQPEKSEMGGPNPFLWIRGENHEAVAH
jgi:hypothetical protein